MVLADRRPGHLPQPGIGQLREPAPHQLRPLLLAPGRAARHDTRGLRRGDVLAQRLAVHPQALGHLVLRPARMPVHQYLGDVDHVERPPCHRPPAVVADGRKVAPSRWPGPPRHASHPHGELRERGGELRERQPLRPGELRERRQRISMRGSLLDIAQRDPGIRAAVMNACLSMCGVTALVIPARRAALRTIRPGAVPVQPPPVRGQEHRAAGAFADGQVDRPGGPRCQRDGDDRNIRRDQRNACSARTSSRSARGPAAATARSQHNEHDADHGFQSGCRAPSSTARHRGQLLCLRAGQGEYSQGCLRSRNSGSPMMSWLISSICAFSCGGGCLRSPSRAACSEVKYMAMV